MRVHISGVLRRASRVLLLVVVAVVVSGVTAAWSASPPVFPDPCAECAFDPPTTIVADPGSQFPLDGPISDDDYTVALSCGDMACLGLAPSCSAPTTRSRSTRTRSFT